MKFDYLKNLSGLSALYQGVSVEETSKGGEKRPCCSPVQLCVGYREQVELLVRYVFSHHFPKTKNDLPIIRLVNDRQFRDFLGKSEYFNEINFIILAGNGASQGWPIDEDTAKLAFENLKEVTYVIFSKLMQFTDAQKQTFQYFKPSTGISEEKTRELYIDENLRDAYYDICHEKGKIIPGKVCIEIEVHHLPNQDVGYVDYVIYSKAGDPLAVIEAKRTSKDEEIGAQQARDYADALVKDLSLSYRPVVYYTNGYTIKIQDRLGYPAREVGNFASMEDLELLISRQKPGTIDSRYPLSYKTVDFSVVNREKIIDAINTMVESFDVAPYFRRKGLIVLPCGVGKTRAAVALTQILMKNEWVKNVLFLADRDNLVSNALAPFEKYMSNTTVSDISAENPKRNLDARICVCTYQTMIGYINQPKKQFTTGHFDLIFVDEAHRSIFNIYRAIFDYFDTFVIGLTATPRDQLDKSTFDILSVDKNDKTAVYELRLEEAVNLHYLVTYKAFDKTLDVYKDGVRRKDLTEEQREEYDRYFADEDGNVPESVQGSKFKNFVINDNSIDLMLDDLMKNGLRVDGGTKIGKTLIFAANHDAGEEIVKRFKKKYGQLGDDFCQLIDNRITKNKTRQDNFAKKDSNPQIVVSVDMMDTGVDIVEIVNLVFFKTILSRIKFDQMIGRGTRTCKGLRVLSPSRDYFENRSKDDSRPEQEDKQGFFIFDWCGNFLWFDEHPEGTDPSIGLNINQKLYSLKLQLIRDLQDIKYQENPAMKAIYDTLKSDAIAKIKNLDQSRVDVHKQLPYVDKYSDAAHWAAITIKDIADINRYLVSLIDQDTMDDTYAKSFDFKVMSIELSLLDSTVNSTKQQKDLYDVAVALLKKSSIAEIMAKKEVLKSLLDEEFYKHLDYLKLEEVRKEVRGLVQYLRQEDEGAKISNFNDAIIESKEHASWYDFESFRGYKDRLADYLKKHFGELKSVQKIKELEPIDEADLQELQKVFNSIKKDTSDDLGLKTNADLIIFIRQIVGLDVDTIDKKCGEFINGANYTPEQRDFINMILDYAVKNGNITNQDLINNEPFCEAKIPELFNYDLSRIKGIIGVFNQPLNVVRAQ